MGKLLVATCIALFTCLAFVRSKVTVENGAYSNVLVTFSQNVEADKGKTLLENLQDHLIETSGLLRDAVNLGISEVTFVIPRSWDTSEWNLTVEPPVSEIDTKADIVVDNVQDSVFGNFPFAQQHGSCGTPGERIVIPSAFLTEKSAFPKGTALAREWLKYRYGVFDENGYPGDELYPQYYHVPGGDPTDLTVTGCTNTPIVYNFIDNTGNNCTLSTETENKDGCRAKPDAESLENVTSSLMFFHEEITNLKHVCGKEAEHPHSSRLRNKHNSLCRGQSVWDVVKTSSDFKDSQPSMSEEDSYTIQFNYVQESKPRVVIAWEKILNMKAQGDNVVKTVRKFLYDLPKGSKYALFPYTEKIAIGRDYSLHELNNWPDDWKIDQIQSDYVSSEEGCVNCAIKKALEILASDKSGEPPEPVGTAVVVASSNLERDEELLERLRSSKVCLMLVVFSNDATPDEYKNYAAASPCGTLVEFSQSGDKTQIFEKLFEAMEKILPETVDDKITETVKTEHSKSDSPISFPVDGETAEKVTFWIARDEFFRLTEAENVKVKINGKTVDLTDEKTPDITSFSFSPKESGNVEFQMPAVLTAIVQVRVTSKAGQYISGDVIYHDLTGKSEEQMPVILYARVRSGPYPVQNAEVSVIISRPDGLAVPLKMYDDGNGDPDITANDGIYSRYFVDFSEKGEYTVTVTVKNSETTTAGKLNKRGGYESCCGSKIETGTVQLESFTKTLKTTFNAVSGRPDLGYQPSRIVDLRVVDVTDDKVVLKWTAPGGEADTGKASKYEMKLFCEGGENTTDCNLYKMVKILNKPLPMNYGLKQQVTIQILDKSQTLSMGIVTVNQNKQESDLSNTIEIFRPGDDTEEITTNPEPSKNEIQTSLGIIIGSSIGSVLILLCIIIGIVYFCQSKPSKKRLTANDIEVNTKENTTPAKNAFRASDYSTNGSPVRKVESFPVLLYTHDQLKDLKRKDKDPPLYKDGVPPKPWVSLNVLSSIRMMDSSESDTKSLSSLSTVPVDGSTETNKTD